MFYHDTWNIDKGATRYSGKKITFEEALKLSKIDQSEITLDNTVQFSIVLWPTTVRFSPVPTYQGGKGKKLLIKLHTR